MQLTIEDWPVVIAYLAILIAIGVAASRRVKDTNQYFLGKRRFGTQLETPSDMEPGEAATQYPHALHSPEYAAGALNSDSALSGWTAENGRQLLIVNLLHLRRGACGVSFFKAYRDDLKGLWMDSYWSPGWSPGCGYCCKCEIG